MRAKVDCSLADVAGRRDGDWAMVGGIITQTKRIRTKKGDPMMFATLDDLEGTVELLVFGNVLTAAEDILAPDRIVTVRGRVDHRDATNTCVIVQEVGDVRAHAGGGRRGRGQSHDRRRRPRAAAPARRRRAPAGGRDRRAQARAGELPGGGRGRPRDADRRRPPPPAPRPVLPRHAEPQPESGTRSVAGRRGAGRLERRELSTARFFLSLRFRRHAPCVGGPPALGRRALRRARLGRRRRRRLSRCRLVGGLDRLVRRRHAARRRPAPQGRHRRRQDAGDPVDRPVLQPLRADRPGRPGRGHAATTRSARRRARRSASTTSSRARGC